MRHRRKMCCAILILITMMSVGVAFLPRAPADSVITRENYGRLNPGMTLDEIEEILGGPARDEASGPTTYTARPFIGGSIHWYIGDVSKDWIADTLVIRVGLDDNGRVCMIGCRENERIHEGLVDTVRRWLRLQTPPPGV
jgi:hypothetical protein